jgi:hypothetical protein
MELAQNAANVTLDRGLGETEQPGDGPVVQSLSQQGQDPAFLARKVDASPFANRRPSPSLQATANGIDRRQHRRTIVPLPPIRRHLNRPYDFPNREILCQVARRTVDDRSRKVVWLGPRREYDDL